MGKDQEANLKPSNVTPVREGRLFDTARVWSVYMAPYSSVAKNSPVSLNKALLAFA